MIKIAFVIDTIESPTAGTEKQLLMLIKHLDRTKFQPYLCVLRSSKWLREEFDLCEIFEAGIYSFKSVNSLINIYNFSIFLRKKGIDMVQTHFRDGNIAGVIASKIAGVKTIVGTRRNQGYWMNETERVLQKILNVWISEFIANSNSTKDLVCRTEKISSERVHVIYNGADLERFEKLIDSDRCKAKESLGIPAKARVVGIVANLRPIKGLDIFLHAARKVYEKYQDVRFIIVGEGSERQNLELLARNLSIEKNVVFLGRRTDIPLILLAFDIGVLSSHSESFSNSLIEYFAAGLPVVSTDVGGAHETITETVNGYIVPVGNYIVLAEKIVELLSRDKINIEEKCRFTANKRFSVSAMVAASEDVYLNIIRKIND